MEIDPYPWDQPLLDDAPGEPLLELRRVVYGPNGLERLCLLYEVQEGGWDFHSLCWELHGAEGWKAKATISREEFQAQHAGRCWVSDLFSLDPQCGWCVIKVAEGDQAEDPVAIRYRYSWRTWDLLRNRDVGMLKECATPHDEF